MNLRFRPFIQKEVDLLQDICTRLSENDATLSSVKLENFLSFKGSTIAKNIGLALKNNITIKSLDLSHHHIEEGLAELIEFLETNCTLETLILSHNNIDNDDIWAIFSAISENKHSALKLVDISYNGSINDHRIDTSVIANALKKNKTIECLNLAGLPLDDNCKKIAEALNENKTLTTLNLSSCRINSGKNLLVALKTNIILTNLNINHNPQISKLEQQKIANCINRNKYQKFITIQIWHNENMYHTQNDINLCDIPQDVLNQIYQFAGIDKENITLLCNSAEKTSLNKTHICWSTLYAHQPKKNDSLTMSTSATSNTNNVCKTFF